MLFITLGLCGVFVALNAYQAATGKRVSKRPSRRTDAEMRRQSALAAIVLGVLGLLLVTTALR
jgi:hypothetical protein